MRDIQDKLGVKNMSDLAIKKIEGIYIKNTYNKLAIEVAERNYCDRNEDEEKEREKKIKDKLGCEFITINADEENFDAFDSMNEMQRQTKRLNEEIIIKETTGSFINELSERLLGIEFTKNNSIICKALRHCEKGIAHILIKNVNLLLRLQKAHS